MIPTDTLTKNFTPNRLKIDWQDSMRELILYWVVEIILYIPRLITHSLLDYFLKPIIEKRGKTASITEYFLNQMTDRSSTINPNDSGENPFNTIPVNILCANQVDHAEFNLKPIEIELPDGRKVKASIYENKKACQNTPTVIRFPGIGETQMNKLFSQLVSLNHPFNFVTFDYAGLGENKDWPISKENILMICLTIYSYLTNNLKIAHNQIHFWGFSLGGAIAIQVKQRLPEHTGQIFCDRTFSSLHEILLAQKGWFLGTIIYSLLWCLKQDLASKETLRSLSNGKVHILNLKNDNIILNSAALFHANVVNSSIDLNKHLFETRDSSYPPHIQKLRFIERIEDNKTAFNYINEQLSPSIP
jgi:hypothetical protein